MSRLFEKYGARYKAGEIIFREGESADGLFMIHSGKVRITKNMGGQDEEITVLEDPEFFGEMAIISAEPRSATAVALTDCEVIKMGPGAFEQAIRENHGMAVSMVRLLTRRLRETNDLLSELFKENRKEKSMRILFSVAAASGKKDKEGKLIFVSGETAVSAVCAQTSLSTADARALLQDLKDTGLIQFKKDASGNHLIGLPLGF